VSLVDHVDPATAADTATADAFDAVICDLQVGARGGMAVTRDLLERAALDGTQPIPAVLLLDRSADAFLAKRAGAAGWVAKPFSSYELVEAMATAADVVSKHAVETANNE
jgi:CheY-like chemotaxis protein